MVGVKQRASRSAADICYCSRRTAKHILTFVDSVLTYLYEDLKTSRAGKLIVYLSESYSTQEIARSRLEVSTSDFQSDLLVSAQTETSSRSLVYGSFRCAIARFFALPCLFLAHWAEATQKSRKPRLGTRPYYTRSRGGRDGFLCRNRVRTSSRSLVSG